MTRIGRLQQTLFYATLGLCLAILLGIIFATQCRADQVTLQWDANNPAPDGYLIYQRLNDGTYDYTKAVVVNGVTNAQGDIPANVTILTIKDLGIICDLSDYYWVARAFLDRTSGREVSGDSNEVKLTVDWTCPPAVTALQATFNYQTNEITMTFNQGGTVPVDHWVIYYTTTAGQNYQDFATVPNTGGAPVVTQAFTQVPDGTRQVIYFTVVSFRFATNLQVFSPNAQEVAVDIDRRPSPQPPTLQIVTIPVQ